ncbi:hypothetical protein RFM99_24710 [Mesorhizobium sp. VK4C]|uniref:hypothetical protein n=1 Tax=Mesorhizobium captivum TaxID=3072319 RepID=UPI002A23BD90|nr:hypothetical protein [Mesorhizobium sp. VK4C]MDX8501604.1 hypothetical protein [Mesorhizobium sp. VK4C]
MTLVPISFEHIHQAVGKAISTWAHVEESLATLFAVSVSGVDLPDWNWRNADLRAAKRAFWAIQAFDSKLKMTNEAAAFHLRKDRELRSEWSRIFNRLSEKKNKRNNLAHGSALMSTYMPFGEDKVQTRFILQPSHGTWRDGSIKRDREWEQRKNHHLAPDAMMLDDIFQAISEFARLSKEIDTLLDKMRPQGPPAPWQ